MDNASKYNVNNFIKSAKETAKSFQMPKSSGDTKSFFEKALDHNKGMDVINTLLCTPSIDPDLFPDKAAYDDYMARFHKRSNKHMALAITNAAVNITAGVLIYKAVAPVAIGAKVATAVGAFAVASVGQHYGAKLNNEHFLRGNQSDLDALLTPMSAL